jgi:Holliday junction resolvasome RuvABC endonuclease subunit
MTAVRKVGAMYVSQVNKKVTPLDRVLTVDCGDHTGWAYWEKDNIQEPNAYGCINLLASAKSWDKARQLRYMFDKFTNVVDDYKPASIVLETLEAWGNDEESLAAVRSGSLFKLAYLIGGYIHIAGKCAEVELILAREWKGQMDKEATKFRVQRVAGQRYSNSHVYDAIGMGYSLMGVL